MRKKTKKSLEESVSTDNVMDFEQETITVSSAVTEKKTVVSPVKDTLATTMECIEITTPDETVEVEIIDNKTPQFEVAKTVTPERSIKVEYWFD